jgi:hypothetical protein
VSDESKEPKLAEMVKDAPEMTLVELRATLANQLAQLSSQVQAATAPMPQGLSEADAMTLRVRRLELAARVAFTHGNTVSTAATARALRLLDFDEFARHILAVANLVG